MNKLDFVINKLVATVPSNIRDPAFMKRLQNFKDDLINDINTAKSHIHESLNDINNIKLKPLSEIDRIWF